MTQARDPAISQPGVVHLRAAVDGNIDSHDQLTNLACKTASRRLLIVLLEFARQRRVFAEQLRQLINGEVQPPTNGKDEPPARLDEINGADQLFAGEAAFALLDNVVASETALADTYALAINEARSGNVREVLEQHRFQISRSLALLGGIGRQRW